MWAAFLVLAVIACALTVGTIMLAHQRNAAQAAAEREHQLGDIARSQQSQAQSERQRAEENFRHAREAVDRMLHTAAHELAGVAKSDRIRHDLLEDALEFYQGFLQQQPDDDSVRRDLALGCMRVGEIHHRLGNNAESAIAFRNARELLVELAARPRSDPELRMDLATVLNELAHVYLEESELSNASEDLIERQIQLLDNLVAENGAEPRYRCELALAHADYGNLLVDMGRLQEAEGQFRQSLSIWEEEPRKVSMASRYAMGAAHTHHALGSLLLSTARHEEAGRHLFEARRLRGEPREPSEPQLEHDLAHLEQDLATFLCKTGDRRGAEPHLREAIAICEKLVADFPAAVDFSYRLAGCNFDLYRVLLAQQDAERAHKALDWSSVYLEKIAAETGQPLKYVLPLARNYYIAGLNSHMAGDAAVAERHFRGVLGLLETARDRFPASSGVCAVGMAIGHLPRRTISGCATRGQARATRFGVGTSRCVSPAGFGGRFVSSGSMGRECGSVEKSVRVETGRRWLRLVSVGAGPRGAGKSPGGRHVVPPRTAVDARKSLRRRTAGPPATRGRTSSPADCGRGNDAASLDALTKPLLQADLSEIGGVLLSPHFSHIRRPEQRKRTNRRLTLCRCSYRP